MLASAGRVGSELVRLQLSKLLPLGTRFQVMPQSEIGADELATADLVVHTGDEPLDVDVPVLRVTRVLDRRALARQLERLQLRLPGQHGGAPGGSVLARVLDEAHFFALPADTEYADAVEFMTGHLEARGLVEAGFGERVRRREEQAQMQLDPWVGFPHVTLEGPDPVMLAIGVVPRRFSEDGVRLIVLLGVPADSELSEAILVQVYDEVLRLGARRDLLDQLCRVTSYEQFYYFFEHNPLTER